MSTLHIVASILGYIGATLLFLQVVLGTRHVFSFFTDDTVLANTVHKFIGIYGTLLVFSHPLFEMMWREDSLPWLFSPSFVTEEMTSISFGRFALYLLLLLWITSALVRENIKWRPWKYLHFIAYPIVFLVFIHITDIGTFFGEYLLIRVVWYSFFAIFILSALFRFLMWSGATKKKSTLLESKMQGESLLLSTFSFPEGMDIPKIGQHVYLQVKSFGSEHPFTVMDIDLEKRELRFGMRMGGPFVNGLKEIPLGSEIRVDGPYGVFTTEGQNEEEKVIIAGGVGVTPFVRLAREYGKNATFLYANRSTQDALYHEELKSWVSKYVDIVENDDGEQNENLLFGRVDASVLRTVLGEKVKTLPYFVCGSPTFIGIMKKMLMDLGVKKEKIFYEELGF